MMILCKNGHFYDSEKSVMCPKCGAGPMNGQDDLDAPQAGGYGEVSAGAASTDTIILDAEAESSGLVGETVILETEMIPQTPPQIHLPQRGDQADPCRCYYCFHLANEPFHICEHCGNPWTDQAKIPIQLAPGTVLNNRYIVGMAEGQGGFGIVYHVFDTKLQVEAAIKEFFPRQLVNRAGGTKEVSVPAKNKEKVDYFRMRFLAEARTLAKFGKHRSIVNVFEFIEDENGTSYFVMEYLKGMELKDYIQLNQGRVDQELACQIVREVTVALETLHNNGIVHRDVAPDNIFLCEGDGKTTVKLIDLGAAKLSDGTDGAVDVICKPGYSPSEMYDKAGVLGPWTDIYSLGATLYVMLTGQKPDEATNRKIEDKLIPPHELNPEVSENMSNAVMKAMAMERQLRFKTVAEFDEAINGDRVVIPLEKERKKRANRRILSIAASLLIVAGLLLAGLFLFRKNDLKSADISVWYAADMGSAKDQSMQLIARDFMDKYPKVKVVLRPIVPALYEEEILTAKEAGRLPALFESTMLDASSLDSIRAVDAVLQSEEGQACYFLNQYAAYYGSSHSKLPLSIEAPMACVITTGDLSLNYDRNVFEKLGDFGSEAVIAADDKYASLIIDNYSQKEFIKPSYFLTEENNQSNVLLTSTNEMEEIKSLLVGYSKKFVFLDAEEMVCRFDNEWSLGSGSSSEDRAADRLLSWMLGSAYQEILLVGQNNEGAIPLNPAAFNRRTEEDAWAPFAELKNKVRMESAKEDAQLLLKDVELPADVLAILTQPRSITSAEGKAAVFSLEAQGEDVVYKWEQSRDKGTNWEVLSGEEKNVLELNAAAEQDGYLYRCTVSDSLGESITSQSATLHVIFISQQPESVGVLKGDMAYFRIEVKGAGLQYQWMQKGPEADTWEKVEDKNATTSFLMIASSEELNDTQYQCRIKDSEGNEIESDAVKLSVLAIQVQPQNITVKEGEICRFEVQACGSELTYCWYYKHVKDADFTKTEYIDAVFAQPAKRQWNGMQMYCVVEDSYGNVVESEIATLTVEK